MAHPGAEAAFGVGAAERGIHSTRLREQHMRTLPIGRRGQARHASRSRSSMGVGNEFAVGLGNGKARCDLRIADHDDMVAALGLERQPIAKLRGQRF
jgi:hypothetical protein